MSLGSALSELQKSHTAAQDKYTYFLFAAAGAAIGFAVQKTDGLSLSWWLLPVAAATISWALSFYCGCRNLHWVSAATSANYSLLQLRAGSHPQQPHPQLVEAATAGVMSALESNTKRAKVFGDWQFRLLILGAVFFIAWRILEMLRITK